MTTVIRNAYPSGRAVLFAALAAAGVLAAPQGLRAAPLGDDVPSLAVHYTDRDLATADGSARLYSRIAVAAERVCPQAGPADMSRLALAKACQAQAIARAVHEVGSPRLAAVSAAHGTRG
jgi:UrcA family protein